MGSPSPGSSLPPHVPVSLRLVLRCPPLSPLGPVGALPAWSLAPWRGCVLARARVHARARVRACARAAPLFSLNAVVGCRACTPGSPVPRVSSPWFWGLLPVPSLVFAVTMLCDTRLGSRLLSVCSQAEVGGSSRASHHPRSPREGCARVDTRSQEAPLGPRGQPPCATSILGPAPLQRERL